MKTVAVSEETWRKLRELKEKMGYPSFNELIEALIERWHLVSLREEIEKISVDYDYEDARKFIDTSRSMNHSSSQRDKGG